MRFNYPNYLKLSISVIILASLTTVVFNQNASASFRSDALSAYNDIPDSLPDDRGIYDGSTTATYRDIQINRDQGRVGQRLNDNQSHQYLTIAGGSIDDATGNVPGSVYRDVRLRVYTTHPENSKDIRFGFVDRAVNLSSGHTDPDCTSDVELTYVNPSNPLTSVKAKVNGLRNCDTPRGANKNFPSAFFQPLIISGKNSGISYGDIRVHLLGSTYRQSSFRVYSSGDLRFGYEGLNSMSNIVDTNSYYMDVYGTKLADHHQYNFYWKPPCDISSGDYIDRAVYDNVDQDNSTIQPDNPFAIRYQNGAQYGGNVTNLRGDPIYIPYGQNAPGMPYRNRALFNNINGGNGIGFVHPYDSANYFLPCPTSSSRVFELDNDTKNLKSPGQYDNNNNPAGNQSLATANRQGRAKANFTAAQFYHSVWNKSTSEDAPTSATSSEVHYYYQRGDSNTYTHGGQVSNAQNSVTRLLAPGESQNFSRSPAAADVNQLYPSGRDPVAIGAWCASRPNGTETAPPATAPLNCNIADGTAWRYSRGDKYCEKVITRNFSSSRPGQDLDKPDPDGAFGPDTTKCVELSTLPPPCVPNPWGIITGRTNIRERGAVDWDESGTKNFLNARVGITYDTWYILDKNGSADQTAGITGEMTRVETDNAGVLGSWGSAGSMPGSPVVLSGPYGFSQDSRIITAADGGKAFFSHGKFTPASGDGCVAPSGQVDEQTALTVPWYYHIKPQTTLSGGDGGTIQQGGAIDISSTLSLPGSDNAGDLSGDAATDNEEGGRQHTYSKAITRNIIQFTTTDENAAKTAVPNNRSGNSGACTDLATYGIPGFGGCSAVESVSDTLNIESKARPATVNVGNAAIGTILCYLTAVSNPVESPNDWAVKPAWRYSAPQCLIVVKSPKVQFLNGDVTVGRHRLGEGGSPCATPSSSATIQTSDAPVAADRYRYGSWVEYGAFASGSISTFGSSGTYATGSGTDRLKFSNTNPVKGAYVYGSTCVDNLNEITGDVNDITAVAGNIFPGEYFTANTNDKTGYVSTGKDVRFGSPELPPIGAADATDSGAGTGTYVVKQCTSTTTSAPDGWAHSGIPSGAMSYSGGCNGGGGEHSLKTYWEQSSSGNAGADQGAGWKFTAPTGMSLARIDAKRHYTIGNSWEYSDPYANFDGLEVCVRYAGTCPGDSGNQAVAYNLNNATTLNFGVYCSVNLITGGNNNTCKSEEYPTSYALSDIALTINDAKLPKIGVVKGTLHDATGGKIRNIVYDASDEIGGLQKYIISAKSASAATSVVLKEGTFDKYNSQCSSDAPDKLVPCPTVVTGETISSINMGSLTTGLYTITLKVVDVAGNSATSSWKTTVDNDALSGSSDLFTGRNIVVYSKLAAGKTCGQAGAGGNLNVGTNIEYKVGGYTSLVQVPRITFIADCNIIIEDNVTKVAASLVAGGAIQTCTVVAKTDAACAGKLQVNGLVQAARLLLLRTGGTDLSKSLLDAAQPAETFDLSPDQMLANYMKGGASAKPQIVYRIDSPPRY